jgi:hypothetical protein
MRQPRHPLPLSVRVDDVVLDRVESGHGALARTRRDTSQDEVALPVPVVEVQPILVGEAIAEGLAQQAVPDPAVEADVLAVVRPKALCGPG